MNKYFLRLLLAGTIITLIVILATIGLKGGFRIENLTSGGNFVVNLVETNQAAAVVLFILIVVLFTAVFSPGIVILTIAGGYLFGTVTGGLASSVGMLIGSILAFLSARYLLHDLVRHRFRRAFIIFDRHFKKDGTRYLLSVRLAPLIPAFVINFLAGLTKARISTFAWTTFVGNLPADFIYAYAGAQIKNVNSGNALASGEVLLAVLLLGFVSLLPVFLRRRERDIL